METGHKVKEHVTIQAFTDKIKNYKASDIICTKHTFFRLNQKQRETFNQDAIKQYIFDDTPVLIGLQYNGCYAVFYKHDKQRFIRVIIDIKVDKIDVVTFYIIDKIQLPVIK